MTENNYFYLGDEKCNSTRPYIQPDQCIVGKCKYYIKRNSACLKF